MNTVNLVKVTVAAPSRRIDLALPERSPLAELLPGLLRHAGEQLPDDGVPTGGWALCRADGTRLDRSKTLAALRIVDGEVLHLVPSRTDWPELEYDDLVDAIASGSARASSVWTPRHTRWAGFAASGVLGGLGLLAVLAAGPGWIAPALASLGVAITLLAAAIGLARAAGDAGAGAVLATLALPYAFAGGGLLFAGDRPLWQLGAAHVLAGSAALFLAAIAGLLGVVDKAPVFTAAAMTGMLGIVSGWAATNDAVGGAGAAAIVAGFGLIVSPAFAPLSIWMARMPMPVLPRTTGDLLNDDPLPPRSSVYASVLRADALLTGLVWGLAVVTIVANVLVIVRGGTAGVILSGILSVGFLLRARLYPILRQRVALLAAGLGCLAGFTCWLLVATHAYLLTVDLPVLLALAVCVALLARWQSTHNLSPYLPRWAEILEILVVLAVVPVTCAVLGLYALIRGLAG
ncbi:type VII secretion integral membrane protein EccD [Fodinicola acaciae]|uniref:type VII secretion integral membrane protein EccD n=1 Tax=Fodinicola acaciae TaxID=2681555 RepID=UPI0013D0608E|nr:type VII secretion integral membrane protein EccD [Fodinicola acaciae]